MAEEIYMKRDEFGKYLNLSRSTVDKLIKDVDFPKILAGDQYRIPLNSALAYMGKCARAGRE